MDVQAYGGEQTDDNIIGAAPSDLIPFFRPRRQESVFQFNGVIKGPIGAETPNQLSQGEEAHFFFRIQGASSFSGVNSRFCIEKCLVSPRKERLA